MENCFICNRELTNLNTPLFGIGKTQDGKICCTSCHRIISTKLHKTSLNKDNSADLQKGLQNYELRKEEKKVIRTQKIAENKMWYDNKVLLIILFFIFPPLGIYAMLKHKTDTWKKVVYIAFSSFSIFLLIFSIYGIVTFDNYKAGQDYYNKKNYMEAYRYFNMISKDDKNYKNAQIKLKELQPKFDSIMLEERKKEIAESNKKEVEPNKLTPEEIQTLRDFQTKWSEKIVKDWEGDYFKNSIISKNGDTINFRLIKEASEGHWQDTGEDNREIYQKEYDSLLKQNFNNKYNLVRTKIIITPDPEQQKINDAKAERENLIKKQFLGFSGANWYVQNYIKDNMNDPRSYEHIETRYKDKGNYILVYTKFRGTNAIGVKIIQTVTAKVDLQGNILSISY